MKKILALALLGAASTLAAAVDGWLLNIDDAVVKAKQDNKLVLILFHGSDWCPPCIKLSNEVLATDAFRDFAKDNLVLLDVDFPRKKALSEDQREHNEKLAQQHNIEGLPTLLLLTPDGKVIDRIVGFPRRGLDDIKGLVANAKH